MGIVLNPAGIPPPSAIHTRVCSFATRCEYRSSDWVGNGLSFVHHYPYNPPRWRFPLSAVQRAV